jgi:uncharacterized protein with FMN-binding domain/ferredoxin
MKKIQVYRLGVQVICLVLTVVGFFVNFKAAMLVIMGLTLLSGVFYCGWICPYGFIQDISSKLGQLLGIKKRKMPRRIQNVLVFSRYIIFGLVTLIATDLIFNIMSFDPRTNFGNLLSGNVVTAGVIAVMCFSVLVALFFDRPFCNYLCYEGAKYGLMSSFRIFTIKRNNSKCVNCKKCDKACPMNIEVSKCSNLRSPQCINCLQCVSSCPVKGALNYGKMNMKKNEKKKMVTALAVTVVLISGYIVYNILSGTNPLNNKVNATNETQVTVSENLESTLEESTVTTKEGTESTTEDKIVNNETESMNNENANTNANSETTSENTETSSENTETSSENTETSSENTETSSENTETSSENTEIIVEDAKNLGDAAGIADGVYTGEGEGFRGNMIVEVTVKDQQIVSVEVVDHREDRRWFNRANNSIPDSIVESQSTDVDLVSGATYSSIGIRDAVKDALGTLK